MFFRGIRAVRNLGYNETQVHGPYTTVLRKISRSYIRKYSTVARPDIAKDEEEENGCCCWNFSDIRLPPKYLRIFESVQYAWFALYNRLGGEWILLTTLGIVVAIFSFIMDVIMEKCNTGRMMMFEALTFSTPLQYFVWVLVSIGMVCFATGFTHLVGPFAIGSGIPEVKTIMRGVPLNEYLSLRTLIAKVVGLSTALGSGLPIGKEGPFVHVASISAALLSKLFFCFTKRNESKNAEVLAAACAVGVACTFAAPIGGVLFSIEVTATYFAVKNYWRGFYSAFVGAFFFRFLAIWFHEEVTLTAYFRTNLARHSTLFVPGEILSYSAVGIICGFGGVLFIYAHKRIVLFVRTNKTCKSIIQTNRFIYPSVVTLVVLSLFFPSGFGQYMGGMLTNPDAVRQLFSNITWHNGIACNYEEDALLKTWRGPLDNVFVTLLFFSIVRFWMCAFATTLPIPAGIFIPSFTLGAGVGRLIGEVLAVCFPEGIGGNAVLPGGYAIVGAAAFAGSVTHTVSTVVIAFEMTGQIGHVLPSIVAVLIACVISMKFTLSLFDVIVEIKKLPFLPGSIKATETVHSLTAKEFMNRDVESVTEMTTYSDIEDLLDRFPYRTFPLIKSKENKMLLGSIHRLDLDRLLNKQLSRANKINYFNKKNNTTQKTTETEQKTIKWNNKDIMDTANNDEVTPKTQGEAEQPVLANDCEPTNESASAEDMEWLAWQLNQTIDLSLCSVDPAPFQLVDKTSLFKVHSMFYLLSLQHAFVTKDGRLVGIISVNEVRSALEREQKSASEERKEKLRKSCARCCSRSVDQDERPHELETMKDDATQK